MGKWEMVRWEQVLQIKNGKNQKAVESSSGVYPIYGSGGIMGYANDYICPENTTIIGRKGSINNPIYVEQKFWNVDTAFGLVANSNLDSKFLYYFCVQYNFQQHNKAVTIPSLTKSDLLQISMPLPPLDEQKRIAKNLDLASEIVKGYKEQLTELDKLLQSVFYEMFGDPVTNSKKFKIKQGKEFFKLSSGKPVPPEKRFEAGIPAYGGNGISWYTNSILFEHDTLVVGRVGFQSGNVRLAKGPLWVTDNAMYMSEYQSSEYNLNFLCALIKHIDFTRFQDAGDLKKITQKPFMQMGFISPPLPLQTHFASIVTEIEAQKTQIQQAQTEAENLFNSLMQEYFE